MHSQRILGIQLRSFPLDSSDDDIDCSSLVLAFKHLSSHLHSDTMEQVQSSHVLKLHLSECLRQLERHRAGIEYLKNERGLIMKQLQEKRSQEGQQNNLQLLEQVMQDLRGIEESRPGLESQVNRQRIELQSLQKAHQAQIQTVLRQVAQAQFKMLDHDLQFIAQKLGLINVGISRSKQNLYEGNTKKKQSGNLERVRTQKLLLKNPSRPEFYKQQMQGLGLAYELKEMKKLIEKVRKPSKVFLLKSQVQSH